MKKLILIMSLIAITLSSCLKDKTYLDFPNAGNIVNFPLSGLANFSADAITADTAVIKFAVDYATATPNKALTVTLGVDTTLIAKYNATSTVQYIALPASAYSFTGTTVNIAAGAQYAFTTITINKYLLDPSKSYMLPVVIKSASGVAISANQSVHYYHVIGNDFGGTYQWSFQRYNAADSTSAPLNGNSFGFGSNTATFSPVSPSEFVVYSGYDGLDNVHYDVTFTKTGTGASAVYSNFAVTLLAADVTNVGLPANGGITFPQAPVFLPGPGIPQATATPSGSFTFAQALKIFHFQYIAMTSADRYIIDTYKK